MNEKENSELRRHTRRDRSNMNAIYGCFVNSQKTILSQFRLSTGTMSENEADKYFAFMKKILSGGVGRNLIDISFSASQVMDSPEHKLLMTLRESALADEDALSHLYQKIIDSVTGDDSYLILVGCDAYDVPFKNKNDDSDDDRAEETYRYLLCGVCPVKDSKPSLTYDAQERVFHDGGIKQLLSAPTVGFLFPSFDDRTTNLYHAQLYTKDIGDNHEDLVKALFDTEPVMAAKDQKRSFEALLETALEEECSMGVVQAVQTELTQLIAMHKESKVAEPLKVGKEQVKAVLAANGVSEDKVAKFSLEYDETFGFEAELHPRNVIDHKRFQVKTPEVTIQVSPESSHLVKTRVIDGVKYILIAADENVEVNGVGVSLADSQE
jgi:hypothetical protein